ncbi:beta-ketoacyl-[acyl-carrier-protein] synthase family protein [Spirosoma sp. 209]|uniref:beta-ketoacyl-[acyl-carrier-protein] synthase family protein n=1 Tax=Spirosoma sp. 209 TaxID=1955701 RepID=UPI00098D6EE4|nr:beta-ketoacyl-[acyl-carrier-protein] synthase family protein [Spirosoma sp. 209]
MNMYVTGMGIVSAIGMDTTETINSILAQRSGLGPIRWVDTRLKNNVVAGEVPHDDNALRTLAGVPAQPLATRTTLLGLLAARQAINQAGIVPTDGIRTGFISASTVGGIVESEKVHAEVLAGTYPGSFVDTNDGAESTDYLARYFGFTDLVTSINTACSSSANAIVVGSRWIRSGLVDRVIVGGTDSLSRLTINGFNSLMLLDSQPCRPFDQRRQGINLGEGAAYLVLESEACVRRAGKTPLARLSGFGVTNDAYHPSASSPEGEGLQGAMRQAMSQAGLQPSDIDYLNTHGTATGNNDITEGMAIRRVFGDAVSFSSTKSFTGHTLAAAGAIEAVIALLSLREGLLPPNLFFEEPIPEHGLSPIRTVSADRHHRHVMSNAAGMGGFCSSLIFSAN